MAFKLASLFVEIGAEDSPLNRTLASIRGRLSSLAGVRFNVPGGGFAAALGLAGAGAAIAGTVKQATDLESRMVGLSKATDLEGAALAKMKGELLQLSTTLKGIRLDDLIDIATSGAKMGVATDDLVRYAEGVAKVASAIDDLPAGVIADQVGKLNTVFKLGVDGTLQLGSAIDKLADSGVSSASGILDVVQRISGAAVAAKITAQEATALAASLLDTGTQAELGASALSHLILALNDVDAHKGFARAIGVDAREFARMVDEKPTEAIQKFLGALKKMDAAGQIKALDAVDIKGAQGQSEIMKLAQQADTLGRYIGLANREFQTLDQINKSYSATASTTAAQWAVMQNQVQILADKVGSALLPAVNSGLSLLGDLATGLGDAFERSTAMVQGWGLNLSGAAELAGAGFRNLGDVFERTGIMIGGVLLNAWEYLSYGGQVAAAVGEHIWGELGAAFDIVIGAAANAKDNLVSIFGEVWDYIKSGFSDPIEFKLKPILEGVKIRDAAEWKMPELNLSSVDNQLAEVDRKIQAREDARAARTAAAAAKATPGGGPGGPKDAAGKPSLAAGKVGVTDADSYARELQEGALKGGDVQKDQLAELKEQTKKLDAIEKGVNGKGGAKSGPATFGK